MNPISSLTQINLIKHKISTLNAILESGREKVLLKIILLKKNLGTYKSWQSVRMKRLAKLYNIDLRQ